MTNILPGVCLRAWLAAGVRISLPSHRLMMCMHLIGICMRSCCAGFRPSQFLLVRQERLRSARAPALLAGLSNFTGLHYNSPVLHDKDEELRMHCEAPDLHAESDAGATPAAAVAKAGQAVATKAGGASSSPGGGASGGGGRAPRSGSGGGRGARRRARQREAAVEGGATRVFVNSHSSYTGHDAVRRTQLSERVEAEVERLTSAHWKMLTELGVSELSL